MKQEISESGMMRIYDSSGNLRMCMQLPAKQQLPEPDKPSHSDSSSSVLLPYTALAISLLSQS